MINKRPQTAVCSPIEGPAQGLLPPGACELERRDWDQA
jgi:hypothetical protein